MNKEVLMMHFKETYALENNHRKFKTVNSSLKPTPQPSMQKQSSDFHNVKFNYNFFLSSETTLQHFKLLIYTINMR